MSTKIFFMMAMIAMINVAYAGKNCVCVGGEAAPDHPEGQGFKMTMCGGDGQSQCASCFSATQYVKAVAGGPTGNGSICADNVCECVTANATGATGADCTTNGATKCTANAGYHMNGATAEANTCTCGITENASAATGAACTSKDGVICVAAAGYTLNEAKDAVTANVCTCEGGTAATGADCTTNAAKICKTCPDTHTLNAVTKACDKKACTCANGTFATGDACTVGGAENCTSDGCSTGYKFKAADKTCPSEFTCTCANGAAAAGPACTKAEAKCGQCDAGFHTDGAACKANTCTCPIATTATGTPAAATGADCTSNNAVICICSAGFHPKDSDASGAVDKCEQNVCTCADGTKAEKTDCTKHNTNICTKCNDEHTLANGLCHQAADTPFTCTCKWGTAAANWGEGCIAEANTCKTCEKTYELNATTKACAKPSAKKGFFSTTVGLIVIIAAGLAVVGGAVVFLRGSGAVANLVVEMESNETGMDNVLPA